MASKRDFYEVLGIGRTANADEIKKAYRKLARKHHPDLNKNDPSAEGRFKEVQEAYDILTDDKKRKAYDQFGHAGVSSAAAAEAAAAAASSGRSPGGFRYSTQTPGGATVGFGDVDIGELFENMMGGGRGRRRGARGRGAPFPGAEGGTPPAGADIHQEVTLPFAQAIEGTTVDLRFNAPQGAETIAVRIPAGVDENSKIRVRGKGQPSPYGGPRGDLIITIHVTPHAYFQRQGADILVDLPLSAAEAAHGITVSVPTLEGPIELRVPAGIASGKRLRIKGRGVPQRTGGRGDQYCRVLVQLPPGLTTEEKTQLAAMDQAHGFQPRANTGW